MELYVHNGDSKSFIQNIYSFRIWRNSTVISRNQSHCYLDYHDCSGYQHIDILYFTRFQNIIFQFCYAIFYLPYYFVRFLGKMLPCALQGHYKMGNRQNPSGKVFISYDLVSNTKKMLLLTSIGGWCTTDVLKGIKLTSFFANLGLAEKGDIFRDVKLFIIVFVCIKNSPAAFLIQNLYQLFLWG